MPPLPIDNIEQKVLDDFTKWCAHVAGTNYEQLARLVDLKKEYLRRDRTKKDVFAKNTF